MSLNLDASYKFYQFCDREGIKLMPLQEDLAMLIINSPQFRYLLPKGAGKTFVFDLIDRFANTYWNQGR